MKKLKKLFTVISTLLAFTILLCFPPVLAKYITEQGKELEVHADRFYFTSDFLSEDEEIPQYNVYGHQVAFRVRNFIDNLRINESDIHYTVTVSAGTVLDETGGTLTGNAKNDSTITLSYDFGKEELQKEITVTVESRSPYAKTLRAKCTFIKSASKYEIVDRAGSYYTELYIYTGDSAQGVTVQWDNEQIFIDETNDYVFGNLSYTKDSVTIENIAADTTVKILFFKKDISQDYSCAMTGFNDSIVMPTATA